MELAWNWAALPGIVGGLLCWALAALVYSAAPARAQNRWLAVLLAVDGVGMTFGFGLLYTAVERGDAWAFQQVATSALLLVPFLYLAFLATLDAPFVGVLRTRAARILLVVGAATISLLRIVSPRTMIADMGPVFYAPWEAVVAPFNLVWYYVTSLVFLLGLVVAVTAARRAQGSVARRRARLYAFAFGLRDAYILFSATYGVLFIGLDGGIGTPVDYAVFILGTQLVEIAFALLLAYAILSAQLFEIDVKLRWTVSRGTVAAAFVAVFLVVTQVAQGFLSDTYGVLAGGAAAGLMLLALAPLQRAAERVAVAAVPAPEVPAAPDDRLALYRDHVRAAWEDGALDRSERRLLDHLRARLGVSADDAMRIEGEVAAG